MLKSPAPLVQIKANRMCCIACYDYAVHPPAITHNYNHVQLFSYDVLKSMVFSTMPPLIALAYKRNTLATVAPGIQ